VNQRRNFVIFEDNPHQRKGLVESFQLIWLFVEVAFKITKLRFFPGLPSYVKQGLVFYCAYTIVESSKSSPCSINIRQKVAVSKTQNFARLLNDVTIDSSILITNQILTPQVILEYFPHLYAVSLRTNLTYLKKKSDLVLTQIMT